MQKRPKYRINDICGFNLPKGVSVEYITNKKDRIPLFLWEFCLFVLK